MTPPFHQPKIPRSSTFEEIEQAQLHLHHELPCPMCGGYWVNSSWECADCGEKIARPEVAAPASSESKPGSSRLAGTFICGGCGFGAWRLFNHYERLAAVASPSPGLMLMVIFFGIVAVIGMWLMVFGRFRIFNERNLNS